MITLVLEALLKMNPLKCQYFMSQKTLGLTKDDCIT